MNEATGAHEELRARSQDDATAPGRHAQESRLSLLFLCQTLPYPPDGGVNIRTYNILRILARVFDITALCFYRARIRPTESDVRESLDGLRKLATIEAFPIPQEHNPARFVCDHVRSLFRRRAYTRYAYESRGFRARLEEVLRRQSFQLAHVDSIDLAAYLPLLTGMPIVCVHHNVESELLRRRAKAEKSTILRSYLVHQAGLIEREERDWCGRVSLNVAVSSDDRAVLATRARRGRFVVVPNGVDTEYFRPEAGPQAGIVFVGGVTWYPNRDALEYFCSEILPHIRNAGVSTRPVRWVGRADPDLQRRFSEEHRIELTGYVRDVRPYVSSAACYVVPLRVGGGTRLKILDAWAMGKAVVSTSVGCEGLATKDGQNILVRDDPEEFAKAVQRVLGDEGLRMKLGQAGRATAERLYDWEVIGRGMLQEYLALVDHGIA